MSGRTDTDRLEWLLDHPNCTVRGSDEKQLWSVLDAGNGLRFLSRGHRTRIEALDAAMDAEERG